MCDKKLSKLEANEVRGFDRNLSYICLGYFVCLCVIVCVCVCHNCGRLCYSFSFSNQTDQGDETEGLEREGLKIER
jgi:hypothetical protein